MSATRAPARRRRCQTHVAFLGATPLSATTFNSQLLLCARAEPLPSRSNHSAASLRIRIAVHAADNSADTRPHSHSHSHAHTSASGLPSVAIIGRPNVGKSALVNRISGHFRTGSIVEDVAGITRDRTYRRAFWNGRDFEVVDTGGIVFDDHSTFLPEIRAQALIAIQEASVAVLVVDGIEGLNPLDIELATFLKRECPNLKKFVAVNKCEAPYGTAMASEFWKLGLDQPVPVSAIHGSGTGDLLDLIVPELPQTHHVVHNNLTNVAIVGRPNVGKSSLLNVLVGSERAIVSTVPGTTRDAVDETVVRNGTTYRLIDTAGIRRRTNVNYGTEFFMVNRAFKAIRRADVVLLLLDLSEHASEQDRKIADRVADEGKACIILGNKWDLIHAKDNKSYAKYIADVRDKLACIPWAKVELISAKDRQRTAKILAYVDEAKEQHSRRVSTAVLNQVLQDAVDWHRPPSTRQAKQGKIYYCTQVSSQPPTIAMFVNDPRLFNNNYKRYIESKFRSSLGFAGTPIRILWRGRAHSPSIA